MCPHATHATDVGVHLVQSAAMRCVRTFCVCVIACVGVCVCTHVWIVPESFLILNFIAFYQLLNELVVRMDTSTTM